MIGEVIQYRGMIKQLAVRDLKLRYERSMLGFAWSLLNPLVMILIYTFFFSMLLRMGIERYPVFLVSVLLPWNFFSRALLSVAPIPYGSGYLLNRAAFPAESLVFSGMLTAFVDFCLEMLVLVGVLLAFGSPLFPGILALPMVMFIHLVFVTGIALFFAVPYVYYRDTQYVLGILVTAWMYMTPIFYPISLVPEKYLFLYKLNPMVHIAGGFRETLYLGHFPSVTTMAVAAGVAGVSFAVGWLIFRWRKWEFAELV